MEFSPTTASGAAVATELGFFEKNRTRMRSGEFRRQGLFIRFGSDTAKLASPWLME